MEVKGKQIIARHRTALIEEETQFRVLESPADKPLKKKGAINIVAPGVPLPDEDEYPNSYYFSHFLDNTVHANEVAKSVCEDERVREEAEVFIPQHVSRKGERLPYNSREFFFGEWLPSESQQLLAILAPAGYGKTVLSCALAEEMARSYLDSDREQDGSRLPFPYLIDFGEFRRLSSFEAMILTSLQKKGITDYHSNAFAYLVAQQRVVLILDGFDELLEERPEEAQKNLRELIETLEGRGKVMITARSSFFRTSDDVADFLEYYLEPEQVSVVDVEPFDTSQRHELVARVAPTQRDITRIKTFIDSDSLAEPMGSPLLLKETIEALLTDKDSRLDRTRGRTDLFRELERNVYQRERERKNHRFSDEVQRSFLQELAREMLEYNARGFDWEEVQVAASEAAADDAPGEAELDRLAHHHFLHVASDSKEARFNHQVFREYFQAQTLLAACEEQDDAWVFAMLTQRPLPEEVRTFLAEVDRDQIVPNRLIESLDASQRPTNRMADNIGSVYADYRSPELVAGLLEKLPDDVLLGFSLRGLDLSGSNWSERVLHGMEFTGCKLDGADFKDSAISEISIHRTSVDGTDFRGASIDSLTVDFGQRVFGTADALERLDALGAECGIKTKEEKRSLHGERRQELIEIVRARLNRFYLADMAGGIAGSRWDSSIQERNLLGGVKPSQIKFVKSKVVPAMVRAGVLERRRTHGLVIYDLTNECEDDARVLLERGELAGSIAEVVDRLLARDPGAKTSSTDQA